MSSAFSLATLGMFGGSGAIATAGMESPATAVVVIIPRNTGGSYIGSGGSSEGDYDDHAYTWQNFWRMEADALLKKKTLKVFSLREQETNEEEPTPLGTVNFQTARPIIEPLYAKLAALANPMGIVDVEQLGWGFGGYVVTKVGGQRIDTQWTTGLVTGTGIATGVTWLLSCILDTPRRNSVRVGTVVALGEAIIRKYFPEALTTVKNVSVPHEGGTGDVTWIE